MKLRHVISARQFNTKTLKQLFALTDKIKKGQYDKKALAGKIMATLFYEPSTRTRLSFESAMLKLGGSVIATENAAEFSSAIKGESLEDTIRVVNFFSDVIVLRHPNPGSAQIASRYSKVPIINGGAGNGEHPTQALYDLYTIFSKFKNPDITVAMMGDLLNGRTIHSLSRLLSLYPKIKQTFISPKALSIPKDLRDILVERNIKFIEIENFEKGLEKANVIYQTRIQKERFARPKEYKKYFGKYIINLSSLKHLKKEAIIMHPLPRVNEIAAEIDNDKRAYYFQQAQNGLFVRMALLLSLLI